MSAGPDVLICRVCGQAWQGASPGARCPNADGGALVTLDVHQQHPTDELLGRVVAGKYPVIGVVGEGGFGAVYRALQEPVGRQVALKVIVPNDGDSELPARFYHEAKVVARLHDPATVTLHDYGADTDGRLFMVFEFIEGFLLSDVVAAGRLEPGRAVDIALQVLGALAEAHSAGLVHRDLKPGNIMLIRNNLGEEKAKVLDFGIAKVMGQDQPDGVETREGVVLGTPRYMSPEQSRDGAIDGRSDLYALGIILYELLTGRVPFDGDSPLEILMAHIGSPVPSIPEQFGVPQALCAVVNRALSKRPEDRYESAEQMARVLRAAVGMSTVQPGELSLKVRPASGANPRPPVPRSVPVAAVEAPRRGKGLLVVLLAAVITGGGVAAFLHLRKAEPPPAPVDEAPAQVVINIGDAQSTALQPVVSLAKQGKTAEAAAQLDALLKSSPDAQALEARARTLPELAPVLPLLKR